MQTTLTPFETLVAFNEKVEMVKNFGFIKKAAAGEISLRVSGTLGAPITISESFPTSEELNAFANVYRMFTQDNDQISIRNLSKLFGGIISLQAFHPDFEDVRAQLNNLLDSPPCFRWPGAPASVREVIETILYGDVSHTDKRNVVKSWQSNTFLWPHIYFECLFSIFQVFRAAIAIVEINTEALKTLPRPGS